MKRCLDVICIVLVLLFFPHCGREKTHQMERQGSETHAALAEIDSLMWWQPDSAFVLLQEFVVSPEAEKLDTFDGHYCQVLISELLYKNDFEQTNRTELLQAVAYFDSLMQVPEPVVAEHGRSVEGPSKEQIVFLAARAHYINGVGYYENDSVVEACKEYLKALEMMEEHFKDKELIGKKARFMALTYTHLTALFSDLYLHEQAIFFAQCSLPYYMQLETPSWNISWVLTKIGTHFDMMNELDSAEYYYQRAMIALNDTTSLMYRDIATCQACIEYKKDPLQADEIIYQLKNLVVKSENNLEYLNRLASIGEIYFHEKQFDSAWYYLNIVYRETSSMGAKKQVTEWLVEICKAQDKATEMLEYTSFLVPFANQDENKSGIKSQLTQLFNAFRQAKSDRQNQTVAKKHARQIITVIGGLLFVMLLIIILYVRNKRHKRKLEVQIETERHAHKMQQAALVGRLKRSNAALKEQEKTASSINSLSFTQQPNRVESYVEEPICQQILAVCNDKNNAFKSNVPVSAYSNIALTDAQKAQLKEAAMRHYGSLFKKLKLQYPELKEKDFLYCKLCLLGLDNIQIAVLTQLSYRTIWEREKRLQTLFHADDRIAIILHGMMMR